jgi:predicted Rossmann-fold nucleotide-binding protein
MGSARNYINVLTSDVIVACGAGGAGTASEIALALKSNKFVVLFNSRQESRALFKKIGGRLVLETDSVSKTVEIIRLLLAKMGKSSTRTIKRQI